MRGHGHYFGLSDTAMPLRLVNFVVFSVILAGFITSSACNRPSPGSQPAASTDEWHAFQGTWIATGTRQSIPLGGTRKASITNFSGTMLLAGPSRPAVGFRAEAIVMNDSATGLMGRAVWTDDRGDQIYSELKGEGSSTGNKLSGAFIGGTGRYTGATGSYEFKWRFVVETEGGTVQGQSEGLTGRIHVGPASASGNGGSRP